MQRIAAAAISAIDGLDPVMFAHADDESRMMPEEASSWREFLKTTGLFPYYINPDGTVVHTMDAEVDGNIKTGAIAVVPVNGVLVREAWTAEEVFWGLVSSDRLTSFIRKIHNDDRIVGALATSNCPGGQVSGVEKLGKAWDAFTAKKKTALLVDDLCASGGVWFGCGSGTINLVGETAEIGSVGVMMSFWDLIPLFEAWGAKYYEYYANESEKKNEGWRGLREGKDPAVIKAEIGRTARLFQERVKSARGIALNANDPTVLQGRMFAGSDALTAGLADGIADFDACIAQLRAGTPSTSAPPANKPEENLAPNNSGTTDTNAKSTTTPPTMNIVTRLVALAAALFSSKEEVTAENIEAANKELASKEITGVVFANAADAEAANTAAESVKKANEAKAAAEAAKATAETERDTAKAAQTAAEGKVSATETALQSVMTELKLEATEGATALDTVVAALKSASTKVTEQQAEITRLKGEHAPDGKAAGAVNTTGDNQEKDPAIAAADKAVEQWAKS
jgi:ClpP class serine protease